MLMKKPIYYFFSLVLFTAGFSVLALRFESQRPGSSAIPAVLGDEDEDEEDEEDEEDDDSDSKPETVTTRVKLPDQIIKRLITETIYDSDGDGVFDPDDSTPNLNDIFIVKDDNLNGIADAYENGE